MSVAARPVLAVRNLVVERSGASVVRGVNLDVGASEILAVVGPNGSGKTSMLEAVSGVNRTAQGSVTLNGLDITKRSRRRRYLEGLRHVRQGRAVFEELSVDENLTVAAHDSAAAYDIFPELRARSRTLARELSGGEQQMLVLALALMTRPACLLIDEISLGLAPSIVRRLTGVIREAAQAGTAVLLVEQFTAVALDIADVVMVLVRGEIALRERADVLAEDPRILHRAYMDADSDEAQE